MNYVHPGHFETLRTSVHLLAPDIYAPDFQGWCRKYTQRGNPLFIPEMRGAEIGARNVFYAIGQHDAIGTSPFAWLSGPRPRGPDAWASG